jgi:PII-like signaling protein
MLIMKRLLGTKKLLKIYIDTDDKYHGNPLWETILKKAKEHGLFGATVYKSISGMGIHSEFKSYNLIALSQSLPLVIEMIDSEEKIRSFLEVLDTIMEEGLVTLSDVEVMQYKHKGNN